ncbi:splicing factor 3A subunit 1 [Metschnikowia aff. pulcherrima]|uniref:Splicing factor 3A subunit 1 n=1 Tax=Metschnikowia aff. pulcherrima TaxID=2163413 RepID=A0A4P6XJQ3_9ASCO|nr:splicing factor 3A subunit 1 [Metschnikowia aff. pulcherrima]
MSTENATKTPGSPPLPIKQAIEKSVLFVLKNGPSFEEKLRQNDANGQFAFLKPDNPHNAYYKHKLEAGLRPSSQKDRKGLTEDENEAKKLQKPRELVYLTDLPPISNHDLEIIKATALYVACNTDKHMEAFQKFMDKRGRRNQFAFMNKSHTLHGLFQSYIRQYRGIVEKQANTPNSDLAKLIDSYMTTKKDDFFEIAYARAAYEKRHKIKEKSREQEIKKRQLHYASIDWQDFSFVSKIRFDAIDEVSELPLPMLLESVVYRSLEAKSKQLELEIGENGAENSIDKSEIRRNEPTLKGNSSEEKNHVPLNVPKGMKIKAAGESRLKRKANEKQGKDSIRCPITGELVPPDQFDTHLKTLLRDPRYKEQQENFVRKNFTYASNLTTDQVFDNIKRLVRKRDQSEEEEAADKKRINLG